jgi:hypothetical protein
MQQRVRYGVVLGACTADPAEPLKVVMQTPTKGHFAALTSEEMPECLKKVNQYNSNLRVGVPASPVV